MTSGESSRSSPNNINTGAGAGRGAAAGRGREAASGPGAAAPATGAAAVEAVAVAPVPVATGVVAAGVDCLVEAVIPRAPEANIDPSPWSKARRVATRESVVEVQRVALQAS